MTVPQHYRQPDLVMQALAAAEEIAVTMRVFKLAELFYENEEPEERRIIAQAIENCTANPRKISSGAVKSS